MPLNNPTRKILMRRLLSISIVSCLAPLSLHAAEANSGDSFIRVVASGASSTRIQLDFSSLNDHDLSSILKNEANAGAQLNIEAETGQNTLVRWALIPPDCGVELKLNNVVSHAEEISLSNLNSLPTDFARLGRPAILRGYRMVPIYIAPVIRDDANRSIRRLENAEFELDFRSALNRVNLVSNPERLRPSRYARKLVEQLVVNPPSPGRDDDPVGGSILYVMGEWNDVEQALAPLIEWRRRMGWKVQILRVRANTDRTQILAAIQDVYDNAEITPEYIVLIGDAPREFDRNTYKLAFYNVQNGAEFAYESDQQYVCLEGDDLLPDAAIGRLPFNTIDLLNGIVAKTVSYESAPYIGQNNNERDWQLRGAVAATDSRSGRSSIDICNWFKDLTLNHGYSRINELFYSNNNPTPDPSDFIATNLTAGASFFLYRGWADMNGYEPNFAGQLRNGRMLPFVVLATCNTGEYAMGNQGSPWTYTERFLTNANGGAIGAVGAAGATHTAYNNILAAGMLAAPFTHEIYTQGWALQKGKVELMRAYQGLGDIQHEENRNREAWWTEYYIFNLMGDPAVELATAVPRVITIENEAQIRLGETFYEVDVSFTDNRDPVIGANVCLYKSGAFQVVELTDAEGRAQFTLNPEWTQAGTIKLTVTGRNLIPVLSSLNIAQAATMIGVDTWSLDDDGAGESSGNDDGAANPTENLELNVQIHNYGQQRPNGAMVAVLETLSPYFTVVRDTLNFNAAPARGASVSGVYLVNVHGDCPDGFEGDLRLKASVGGQDFFSSFSMPFVAPILEFDSVRWSGSLAPGSRSGLTIDLRNTGSELAPATHAELISLTPTISVLSAQIDFLAIGVGREGTCARGLMLAADRWHLPGNPANLALALLSQNGFCDTVFFSLTVGTRTEITPFGPDKYGYLCYDDSDTGWASRPTYNWLELNPRQGGDGTNLRIYDRVEEADVSVLIDLPFEFTYYGETFDNLTVCSNGWAAFGDHHTLISGRNRRIPCSEMIPAMLAPFWDELITTANGGVFSGYDEPNHRFILEWSQMRKLGPEEANEPLESFEIILYDPAFSLTPTGDGEIIFQYQDVTDTQSCFQRWDTPFATIGIGNLDGTDGLEYSYWGHRAAGAAPLRDGRAIKFTTATGAPVGLLEGRIADSMTGEPISQAVVHLPNGFSTNANADGYYRMISPVNPDGFAVRISAQFYNDSTVAGVAVSAADTTELNVALLKPLFSIDRDTLVFECTSSEPQADFVQVQNHGNGTLFLSYSVREADWLTFAPPGDTLTALDSSRITLYVSPEGLVEGEYHAEFLIDHNASPGSLVIPITLQVSLGTNGDPTGIPYEFELSQNFPNPFNSSTTINFELASDGPIHLSIIDLNGREQFKIMEGWRAKGRYSLALSADKLAAGIYFYRLEANGAVITRKLALMK